jgi:hypothetical protein
VGALTLVRIMFDTKRQGVEDYNCKMFRRELYPLIPILGKSDCNYSTICPTHLNSAIVTVAASGSALGSGIVCGSSGTPCAAMTGCGGWNELKGSCCCAKVG